jgi:hypothetical protein
MDANKSKRDIGKIRSGFDLLGPGDAFVFELRIVPELDQETEFKSGCVKIIQQLRSMFVN